MAEENWKKSLELVLKHEGGYVNHPEDPGGETNLGVTKAVYEEWCMENDLVQKDMADLVNEDVESIYKKNYWDRTKADDLPAGLDLCVFDFAVNAGPGRAAGYVQALVGSEQDGAIGPNTLKAVSEYVEKVGVERTIEKYQNDRQRYYEKLDTFKTFGRGWTKRVKDTTKEALKLI